MNQIISNSKRYSSQGRSNNNFSSHLSYINNTNGIPYTNNKTNNVNGVSSIDQMSSDIKNALPIISNNNTSNNEIKASSQNMNNNNISYMNNANMANMTNMSYFTNNNIPFMNNNVPNTYNNMNRITRDNFSYLNNNIPNVYNNMPYVNYDITKQNFQRVQQQAFTRSKSLAPQHQIQQNAYYPYFNQMGSYNESVPSLNTSKNVNSPTGSFQTVPVPDYIRDQIEAIVNDAPDNKIKASDLFKEYVRRYKKLIISDAYSFPSFKDLVLSFGNLFSIEQLPDSYEYYVCKYVPPKDNVTPKNAIDENNNTQQTSPIVSIKLDVSADSDFAEINKYEEVKDSTEIQTKKISINHIEKTNQTKDHKIAYDFNLISVRDGEKKKIFIHWLQVANLFEIKSSAFKRNYLIDLKYPLSKCISKYKMNESNKVLFDFVEKRLNVNLKDYDDIEETTFFLKDSLNEACDYIFNKNNCQTLKELIKKI